MTMMTNATREEIWTRCQIIFCDLMNGKHGTVGQAKYAFHCYINQMALRPGDQYGTVYKAGMDMWEASLKLAKQSVLYVSAENILSKS
jgi:hypothetical protein